MARSSARQKIDKNLLAQDAGVRWYFGLLPELLDKISSCSPALAYCFQQIEAAQRVGLYALLMREYRTDSALTWKAVDQIDITRVNFPEFFERILGSKLDSRGRQIIVPAEAVRDAITHGRQKSSAEIHDAILKCLEYVEFLNDEFFCKAGFRPVGPLRGVTSKKGKPQLDKKITRAVLGGLGFRT
jgi:hypothetical protein